MFRHQAPTTPDRTTNSTEEKHTPDAPRKNKSCSQRLFAAEPVTRSLKEQIDRAKEMEEQAKKELAESKNNEIQTDNVLEASRRARMQ